MTEKFKLVSPIDWDKWFSFTAKPTADDLAGSAFSLCRDDCECEDECGDEQELRLALADAAIALADANKILAEVIDRLYGER